jgi:RNA polymerase sigma-70 factor (ECF subfamily)
LSDRRSDQELVEGLRAGEQWATTAIFDRHGADVLHVLAWILGVDRDLPDLLHDVFLRAFESIGTLDRSDRLKPWLLSIGVFTARECIRKRQRARWFQRIMRRGPADLPHFAIEAEQREFVAAARAALSRLEVDERVAFTLRFVAELELQEAADACGVSLATIKRRISSARSHFATIAQQDPVLAEWMEAAACDRD